MKASGLIYEGASLLEKLNKVRSEGYRDPDIVKLNVGENKAASNIMRPVGDFESANLHYLWDFVGEDAGVPRSPVCPGRKICPVCAVASQFYAMGTEEAREQAKQFYSSKRLYWNVLPRWAYEWDDQGPRFMVLSFGVIASRSLYDIVSDIGDPHDPDEGFDLNYKVEKKKGGYGNDCEFVAVSKRRKTREGIGRIVIPTPLTEEELDYDIVDLSKYTTPPTEEELETLAEIFSVDILSPSKKKRRAEVEDEDEEEDDDDEVEDLDDEEEEDDYDEEDDDDDILCLGDSDVFDAKSSTCKRCPFFLKCRKEVRRELLSQK